MGVQPVGRYALRLRFDDLYDGIYPFDYLAELAERRLAWSRAYLRLLRHHGLSRDPKTREQGATRVNPPSVKRS
jgi:DUF971 family protein